MKAVLDDIESVVAIQHHIDRILDARRTRAGGVEGQEPQFYGEIHGGIISQYTIEEWFPIAGFADDTIGSSVTHLHPIALRVNKKELVLQVLFELTADQCMEVETQPRFVKRVLVFVRHAANLCGKHIDGLKQLVKSLITFTNGFIEIGDGFIPDGPQA